MGLDSKFWLFDSWYFTNQIIDKVRSYQADYLSQAKSNRGVFTPRGVVKLIDYLQNDISREAYKEVILNGKTRYYFTKVVVLKSTGGRRTRILALFDNKDLSDKPKILVTSKLNWTSPKKIWEAYTHRWSQETFYRDSKQDLGLESYQLRSIESIEKHWCLVELAYTLLMVTRVTSPVLNKVTNQLQSLGGVAHQAGCELLQSFVVWIHQQLSKNTYDANTVCQVLFADLNIQSVPVTVPSNNT